MTLGLIGAVKITDQLVDAAVQTKIVLPHGYNRKNLNKQNYTRSGKHFRNMCEKRLVGASMYGMIDNNFYDTNASDNRMVDIRHLSHHDQIELSKYTVRLINSARRQMHRPALRFDPRAQSFANDIAKQYERDNWDCNQSHNIKGILKVAKYHGLMTDEGNIYENLSGIPYLTPQMPMSELKMFVYYNMKQFLFGGFVYNPQGSQIDHKYDPSYYTEWFHAKSILDKYDGQFALSFSVLSNNSISTHFITVAPFTVESRSAYNHR